jgi:hypothetical protein
VGRREGGSGDGGAPYINPPYLLPMLMRVLMCVNLVVDLGGDVEEGRKEGDL